MHIQQRGGETETERPTHIQSDSGDAVMGSREGGSLTAGDATTGGAMGLNPVADDADFALLGLVEPGLR
jgi:hypothetical protein